MLNSLKELPNIYLVFTAFIILIIVWFLMILSLLQLSSETNSKVIDLMVAAITGIFTLANTALGAIIGISMRPKNANEGVTNIENVEKLNTTAVTTIKDK